MILRTDIGSVLVPHPCIHDIYLISASRSPGSNVSRSKPQAFCKCTYSFNVGEPINILSGVNGLLEPMPTPTTSSEWMHRFKTNSHRKFDLSHIY